MGWIVDGEPNDEVSEASGDEDFPGSEARGLERIEWHVKCGVEF